MVSSTTSVCASAGYVIWVPVSPRTRALEVAFRPRAGAVAVSFSFGAFWRIRSQMAGSLQAIGHLLHSLLRSKDDGK